MKNSAGREIPEFIESYGEVKLYEGAFANMGERVRTTSKVRSVVPTDEKLLP